MSPMECGLGNFLLTVAIKTVRAYSRLLGWVSIQSSAVEDVGQEGCGWRFERGSPVRNARVIFGV